MIDFDLHPREVPLLRVADVQLNCTNVETGAATMFQFIIRVIVRSYTV